MTQRTISPAYTPTAGFGPSSTPIAGVGVRGAVAVSESAELQRLSLMLHEERGYRMQLEQTIGAILQEMQLMRARLDKLDPPISPLKAEVKRVEARGNIRVNHETGHVNLLRPIDFQPRTTRDPPTGVLKNVEVAREICRDLAEIAVLFQCPMTVEGHTKGGESEFWHQLANDRARIVVDLMIQMGAPAHLIDARGLPGKLGRNEARTVVFMDVSNIDLERLQPIPFVREIPVGPRIMTEVVSPPNVVYGAPVTTTLVPEVMVETTTGYPVPVVEKDLVRTVGSVNERDIYVGGRLVDREIISPRSSLGPPTVEREIISPRTSLGPLTVERDIVRADGRFVEEIIEPAPVQTTRLGGIQSLRPATARTISAPPTVATVLQSAPRSVSTSSTARRMVVASNGMNPP